MTGFDFAFEVLEMMAGDDGVSPPHRISEKGGKTTLTVPMGTDLSSVGRLGMPVGISIRGEMVDISYNC